MEFISGEDRNQTLLLPDSVEDYVDDNNVVRVIDAYISIACALRIWDLCILCPVAPAAPRMILGIF